VSLPIPTRVTAQDPDAALEPYEVAGALPPSPAMDRDFAHDFFSLMQRTLSAPGYEYDGPFPVGGVQGTFHFANNYDTQAEWALVAVTFLGGTGFYAVSENEPIAPTSSSAYGTDPYTSKRGWVIASDTAKTIPLPLIWTPFEPRGQIGINVVAAAGSAIGMFYTRRRVLPNGTAAQSIR
jgi:hypothetical protein